MEKKYFFLFANDDRVEYMHDDYRAMQTLKESSTFTTQNAYKVDY